MWPRGRNIPGCCCSRWLELVAFQRLVAWRRRAGTSQSWGGSTTTRHSRNPTSSCRSAPTSQTQTSNSATVWRGRWSEDAGPTGAWRWHITPWSSAKAIDYTDRSTTGAYTGQPKKLYISICSMLNWYSFVKSQPNFKIFGWEEDILNIACKLISTILCDWHYLVVCQHNSWANFILRQHRKRTILFLQGSVETHNRCCRQYMHVFVGNLFRCKSAKNYKIRLRFHEAISI